MNYKNKKSQLLKNRRGQEMLIDFWAILIFAIIVVLFFVIFYVEKTRITKTMETEFANKDTDFMLNAFLRAPLVDDPTRTVSDIIVEESVTGKFTKTRELFETYFARTTVLNSHDVNDILLQIKSASGTKNLKMTTIAAGSSGFGRSIPVFIMGGSLKDNYASTYIPGYDGKIQITLRVSEAIYKETVENEKISVTSTGASGTGADNNQNTPKTPDNVPDQQQLNMPGSANNPIQ